MRNVSAVIRITIAESRTRPRFYVSCDRSLRYNRETIPMVVTWLPLGGALRYAACNNKSVLYNPAAAYGARDSLRGYLAADRSRSLFDVVLD